MKNKKSLIIPEEVEKKAKIVKKRLSIQIIFVFIVLGILLATVMLSLLFSNILSDYVYILQKVPTFVWLILLSIIIGAAMAWFVSFAFFAPITKLQDAMGEVANGNFDLKLETNSKFNEIKEIYSHFNLMVKELGATETLQSDFISNVSHEFKTPINAIEGYATLLQDKAVEESERGQYIEKILFNTRRLSELVGNILLLSKVDCQAIESKKSTFRLDEQIRQCIVALEPKWEEKNIEFDVELEDAEYFGNEGMLFHVWSNLIDNAVKFDSYGGMVKITLEDKNREYVFVIEDNGEGIADENKKAVFNKFFQEDTSHKQEGNGLGLALVKRILDLSGGRIEVSDRDDGGCRFTVSLPKF